MNKQIYLVAARTVENQTERKPRHDFIENFRSKLSSLVKLLLKKF